MIDMKPNFVTDSQNRKVAVQLNIKTYNKIQEILENYGLYRFMEEAAGDEPMTLDDAKAHYKKLRKRK